LPYFIYGKKRQKIPAKNANFLKNAENAKKEN